ncbi:MAG: 50S ribosomal protein L21 [Candidatus Uhrbacteria bacterium]
MIQHAVIKTGGKQHLVALGKRYQFEKIVGNVGDSVTFPDTLLVFDADESSISVGTPIVTGASVRGTIIRQGRTRKITVVKYRAKSRYRRKLGHRQHFTEVEIADIAVPSVE